MHSTGLEQELERLFFEREIRFELYNSKDIENCLRGNLAGFRLAKRFFPRSIQDVWPQVISLKPAFTAADAEYLCEGKWIVQSAFNEAEQRIFAYGKKDAVRLANEKATAEIHLPMFLAAWEDAVKHYPNYFCISKGGVDSASSVDELPPK